MFEFNKIFQQKMTFFSKCSSKKSPTLRLAWMETEVTQILSLQATKE